MKEQKYQTKCCTIFKLCLKNIIVDEWKKDEVFRHDKTKNNVAYIGNGVDGFILKVNQ